MLSHPRQKAVFNASGTGMIKNLVYQAVSAFRDLPQFFHIINIKVGNAPFFDLSCFFHTLQLCYGFFQRIVSSPVIQIKIQVFHAHPLHGISISRALAALFSPRNQVPSPKAGSCTPFLNVTVCFILDQTCFFHFFFHLIIRRTFWCWKIW